MQVKLNVTEHAAKWYKNELAIESTGHIRFFPRYGFGGHIPGFSIGINTDLPKDILVSVKVENITFYIESKDEWYFDGHDLNISFNESMQEPEFSYV